MVTTAQTILDQYGAGKRDFLYLYLPDVDLSNFKNLSGANFSYSYLLGAKLWGSFLIQSSLNYTFLGYAQLQGASLVKADLTYAYLCNADLSKADLTGASLRHADLTNANLSGAKLGGADLTGATLKGANFKGASFEGGTPYVLASGKFEVQANQPGGVKFTNPVDGDVSIVCTPLGKWSAYTATSNFVCDASGLVGPDYTVYQKNSPYPQYNLGALVAASADLSVATLVNTEKQIPMKPNETLIFMMNDDKRYYADNTGYLTVNWKAIPTC
ncbi:pentapeptide repeat-containing protein [Kamptonema formosum]|uniref:pentapeptide repeat-containing protein n=1 Tax=Kamptonema formosum TaxID=331992 RepID=UPI00034CC4D9|nr:pentapeptide repeat-containing protein [Oscillatoria sp. PCC 10802]